LDTRIAAAQAKLEQADLKTASKETDAQSAAFAKITGTEQNLVAATAHVILALGIEFGSGLGFWLAFGHGGSGQRERPLEPVSRGTALALPSPAPMAEEPVMIETPSDAIERFFLEAVRPTQGRRVPAAVMYAAYEQWCIDHGLTPLSSKKFGLLATWRKERSGGRVWYLNAQLIGYGLQVAVDNTAARNARLQVAQAVA
jgi:Poxvirus D5 protein-like